MNEPATRRRTILLVDDDRKLIGATKQLLELRGYWVKTAVDVPAARRLLEESIPDVILMDIKLPGGSGIDFCREIRSASDVPIIFVTGLEKTDELLESGFDAGGDDYMNKPVNFNELVLRIQALIRREEKAQVSAARLKELALSGEGSVNLEKREIYPAEIDEEKFERLKELLNKREKEVARLMAFGMKNKEISARLSYSIDYVKKAAPRIYVQAGASNRAEFRKAFLKD